tara:strand:+ start:7345 stop:7572 length:228 start_codon:yes stop_codon:yes gene_type:complete
MSKSSHKNLKRLSEKGKSFASYVLGQRVTIYTGDGWKKGRVENKTPHAIAIHMDGTDDRAFPRWVYDTRNCLPLE